MPVPAPDADLPVKGIGVSVLAGPPALRCRANAVPVGWQPWSVTDGDASTASGRTSGTFFDMICQTSKTSAKGLHRGK